MQASKRHMELENGKGLCSRPMWSGGMPEGFCDNPAYGEQEKGQTRSGEWLHGKFNPSYCAGLACYAHGGPKEPIASLPSSQPAVDNSPTLPTDMEALLAEAVEYANTSVMRGMGSAATSANWICRLATALRETLAREQAEPYRHALEQRLIGSNLPLLTGNADADLMRFVFHEQELALSPEVGTIAELRAQVEDAERRCGKWAAEMRAAMEQAADMKAERDALRADLAAARKELDALGEVEWECYAAGFKLTATTRAELLAKCGSDTPNCVRAIRRVLEGGAA